jgi:excisionase family DNA binding protein
MDGPRASRDLYTIEEARAQLGGISRNTLYDLLRNGELASIQIGRRRFISAAALDAFIATSTTTASPSLGSARTKRTAQMPLGLAMPSTFTTRRRVTDAL